MLPRWAGRVSVYVPATEERFRAAIDGSPSLRGVAAVTVPAAGGVRVVVNPRVFGAQRPWARRAVLAHEFVHVATGAVYGEAPGWLSEGFADYVALRGHRQAQARLLRAARAPRAAPMALPGPQAFTAQGGRRQAAYARSWLACALIARGAGERRLVRVHTAAQRGVPWRLALARHAGVSGRDLVAQMQRPGALLVSWGETSGAPGRSSGPAAGG